MAKYTKEQLAQMQELIKKRKKAEADAYKASMLEKSAIFRKPIGKALKLIAWIGLIVSSVYFIDIFLSPNFSEKKIEFAEDEILDVYSQDGYHVPVTYYWVYLNKNKDFGIFMFHGTYEIAQPSGSVWIGQSPIFGTPTSFMVKDEVEQQIKSLKVDYPYTRILPITIFIVCLLWVLMNPADNIQFVIYGYFSMFVIPILLILFFLNIGNNFQDKGFYEMDIKDLRLQAPIEVRR